MSADKKPTILRVTVWGAPRTGKTTFVAALLYHLKQGMNLQEDENLRVQPFYQKTTRRILEDRSFPAPTIDAPLFIDWQYTPDLKLQILDLPGAWCDGEENTLKMLQGKSLGLLNVFKQVVVSNALIIMLNSKDRVDRAARSAAFLHRVRSITPQFNARVIFALNIGSDGYGDSQDSASGYAYYIQRFGTPADKNPYFLMLPAFQQPNSENVMFSHAVINDVRNNQLQINMGEHNAYQRFSQLMSLAGYGDVFPPKPINNAPDMLPSREPSRLRPSFTTSPPYIPPAQPPQPREAEWLKDDNSSDLTIAHYYADQTIVHRVVSDFETVRNDAPSPSVPVGDRLVESGSPETAHPVRELPAEIVPTETTPSAPPEAPPVLDHQSWEADTQPKLIVPKRFTPIYDRAAWESFTIGVARLDSNTDTGWDIVAFNNAAKPREIRNPDWMNARDSDCRLMINEDWRVDDETFGHGVFRLNSDSDPDKVKGIIIADAHVALTRDRGDRRILTRRYLYLPEEWVERVHGDLSALLVNVHQDQPLPDTEFERIEVKEKVNNVAPIKGFVPRKDDVLRALADDLEYTLHSDYAATVLKLVDLLLAGKRVYIDDPDLKDNPYALNTDRIRGARAALALLPPSLRQQINVAVGHVDPMNARNVTLMIIDPIWRPAVSIANYPPNLYGLRWTDGDTLPDWKAPESAYVRLLHRVLESDIKPNDFLERLQGSRISVTQRGEKAAAELEMQVNHVLPNNIRSISLNDLPSLKEGKKLQDNWHEIVKAAATVEGDDQRDAWMNALQNLSQKIGQNPDVYATWAYESLKDLHLKLSRALDLIGAFHQSLLWKHGEVLRELLLLRIGQSSKMISELENWFSWFKASPVTVIELLIIALRQSTDDDQRRAVWILQAGDSLIQYDYHDVPSKLIVDYANIDDHALTRAQDIWKARFDRDAFALLRTALRFIREISPDEPSLAYVLSRTLFTQAGDRAILAEAWSQSNEAVRAMLIEEVPKQEQRDAIEVLLQTLLQDNTPAQIPAESVFPDVLENPLETTISYLISHDDLNADTFTWLDQILARHPIPIEAFACLCDAAVRIPAEKDALRPLQTSTMYARILRDEREKIAPLLGDTIPLDLRIDALKFVIDRVPNELRQMPDGSLRSLAHWWDVLAPKAQGRYDQAAVQHLLAGYFMAIAAISPDSSAAQNITSGRMNAFFFKGSSEGFLQFVRLQEADKRRDWLSQSGTVWAYLHSNGQLDFNLPVIQIADCALGQQLESDDSPAKRLAQRWFNYRHDLHKEGSDHEINLWKSAWNASFTRRWLERYKPDLVPVLDALPQNRPFKRSVVEKTLNDPFEG